MNYTLIIVGTLAIIYGIYTFFLRKKRPDKLPKLTEMKERMGSRRGYQAHFISYTAIPVFLGLVLIISELIKR